MTANRNLTALVAALVIGLPSASLAGGCNSWDLNCDPNTGGRTYDLNRYNRQQVEQNRSGNGTWNLNKDKWGDNRYDQTRTNGCPSWNLNCR